MREVRAETYEKELLQGNDISVEKRGENRVRVKMHRTGKRPLTFEGELLAAVSTSLDRNSPLWSETDGLWERITVWRTKRGDYVVGVVTYTMWVGARTVYEGERFVDLDRMVDWLEERVSSVASRKVLEELGRVV